MNNTHIKYFNLVVGIAIATFSSLHAKNALYQKHTFVLDESMPPYAISLSVDYREGSGTGCSDKKFILIPKKYSYTKEHSLSEAHDDSNQNLPVYQGSYTVEAGDCEIKGIVMWITGSKDGNAKKDNAIGKDLWWTNPPASDWQNGAYGNITLTIGWDKEQKKLWLKLPNTMAKPDRPQK